MVKLTFIDKKAKRQSDKMTPKKLATAALIVSVIALDIESAVAIAKLLALLFGRRNFGGYHETA